MNRTAFAGYRSSRLLISYNADMIPKRKRSMTEGIACTVIDLSNSIQTIIAYVLLYRQAILPICKDQFWKGSFRYFDIFMALFFGFMLQSLLDSLMYRLVTSFTRNFANTVQSLRRPLQTSDPEIFQIIQSQKKRQFQGINLIASENYCSNACLAAVGSILNNKYAEGYPGVRYYGGTEYVDKVETLCQNRALEVFNLSNEQWGVNVQALSGSPANMAVYTGLLNPHDRIMSLELSHGGHLSHGFQQMGKKISATSKYFQVFPYRLDEETGIIDYQALHKISLIYRPKLIIAGASSYSRLIDYKKFREICDQIGAYLLADIAHPAGLMAAGVNPAPFPYADVVTTTTHKTLRGTRGALIYYRIGSKKDKKGNEVKYDLKTKIDSAVFPGLQGGPHMHSIAGMAVTLAEAKNPEFREYQRQTLKNIQAACSYLQSRGYTIVSGGTDNHLFLVDMRSRGTDGGRIETLMNEVSISINKNAIPGDTSALIPSGIRIGSPAMTTRGCKEADFVQIMKFLEQTTVIVDNINKKTKGKRLKDFKDVLQEELESNDIISLKRKVNQFSSKFPIPGGFI